MQGGVRRKRTSVPTMSGDNGNTIIRYRVQGNTIGTDTNGLAVQARLFVGGDRVPLVSPIGPEIVSNFSTYRFMPGTTVQWEPSVSFSSSGRLFVGFVDNPEVTVALVNLLNTYIGAPTAGNYNQYADAVKALGSTISFPIWQETAIPFPTRMRRKRFDTNLTVAATDPNVLDRCMQCCMFVAVEGTAPTVARCGNFLFHDVVEVEGIHGILT